MVAVSEYVAYLLHAVQVVVLVLLDPGLDPGNVHGALDDLVVVGQLLPARQLIERFREHSSVRVLVLVHNLDRKQNNGQLLVKMS